MGIVRWTVRSSGMGSRRFGRAKSQVDGYQKVVSANGFHLVVSHTGVLNVSFDF